MLAQQLITALLAASAAACALAAVCAALCAMRLMRTAGSGSAAAQHSDGEDDSARYIAQLGNFLAYDGSERGQQSIETGNDAG